MAKNHCRILYRVLDRSDLGVHTDFMEKKKTARRHNSFWTIFGSRSNSSNVLESGFTLLELLITMAVLGVLIGAMLTLINPATQLRRAKDGERKNTLFQLRSALEVFYNDNNVYPSTGSVWFSSETGDANGNNGGNWIPALAPTYIQKLPKDPEGGTSPACGAPWKRSYHYKSDGQSYALLSHCSMEPGVTWSSSYGLYDPCRPTLAWKVCVGAGCENPGPPPSCGW